MVMAHDYEPKILGFLCNWCCYAGADLAGVSRYQYPPNIRVIRMMCSGRIDPKFIFRAFSNGADGVFIGGCWLDECHYVTNGNYHAVDAIKRAKKLLQQLGLNPDRLRLEWVSASEGVRFAEVITNFTRQLKELGPLGVAEGRTLDQIQKGIAAAEQAISNKLVSYYIDPAKCQACGICARRCPQQAISGGRDKVHVIDQTKCIACSICKQVCPARFDAVVKFDADPVPDPIPEEARTIVRAAKAK